MFIYKIPLQGCYFLGGPELRNHPRLEFTNPDKSMLSDEQVATILGSDSWVLQLHFRTFATIYDARAACAEVGVADVQVG
jgi:hypothetical protein